MNNLKRDLSIKVSAKKEYKCSFCNEIVIRYTNYSKNIYCNRECKANHQKLFLKGKAFYTPVRVIHFCKSNCGRKVFSKNNNCSTCSKVGKNNPNYGKKHSIETREKISESLKGLFSGEKNPMYSIRRFGKKSPGYKNGLTTLYKSIREIKEYKIWRKQVFERDNYTCQMCNIRGGYLEVDHIEQYALLVKLFLAKYNMFSPVEDKETLVRLAITHEPFWNLDNGRTLCLECHVKTDNYGLKSINI